ncbi:chromosome partitioning protein ParB, partial [Francisella tularensis subsp. holarctica]|nr:chromosome partitioning protein ParB [Francisella tularensis subsp. holarctica]
NKISCSYRSAITLYLYNWKLKAEILDSKKIDVITIKDIAKDGNILKIKGSRCGTKNYTYTIEITPEFKKILFDALIN